MKILNMAAFAAEIGRHPSYVSLMKRAGFFPSHGTKTTLRHGLDWLADNPDFRTTLPLPPLNLVKSRQVKARRSLRGRLSDLPVAIVGKSHEPARTNG